MWDLLVAVFVTAVITAILTSLLTLACLRLLVRETRQAKEPSPILLKKTYRV